MAHFGRYFILLKFLISGLYGWCQNIPPTVLASGDQSYCPGDRIRIATDFDIIDPDDTGIEAFFIQISEGYTFDEDVLLLAGSHPNLHRVWDATQGKLSFFSSIASATISYNDLIAAVKDVVYDATPNTELVDKVFSFTIGDANYLPSTGHFYEYVPNFGITWAEARLAAASRNYFGLQGYLATVTTPEEAKITGEQAAGAGWIGGSDAGTEGVWQWVTGPEAGTVFWNGGINGSTPNFANWNTNEPNDCCSSASGDENYAHITSPNVGTLGSWNDLPNAGDSNINSDFHPQGYIVEYGGSSGDPAINISASTRISIPSITNMEMPDPVCGPQSVTLEATPSSGDIIWFNSATATTPVFTGNTYTTPIVNNTRSYFASVSVNGCLEGKRVEFPVIINPIPSVEPMVTFKNCDVDGLADGFTIFNLEALNTVITTEISNDINITYHSTLGEAELGAQPLNPFPYNNSISNTIYGRVERISTGCFAVSIITLEVSTAVLSDDFVQDLSVCDDTLLDGLARFDLTELSEAFINQFPSGQNLSVNYYRRLNDAQLELNAIGDLDDYSNETLFLEVLYVRIESEDNGDCFGIGPNVLLTVHPIPEFEVEQQEVFCLNGAPVTLLAINASDTGFTYEWKDSSGSVISTSDTAMVASNDTYGIIATSEKDCSSQTFFYDLITSEVSTITLEDITIEDVSDNNVITIDTTDIGLGDYEFALDNALGPFQDIPVFTGVLAGEHKLYVRDKNNCGTTDIPVFVLGFPKFFTPNSDGVNDSWDIKGLSDVYIQNSSISIFNRYGKLIKQLTSGSGGWDGMFNGSLLSADDYWFVVNLVNTEGETQVFTGHFSLIR